MPTLGKDLERARLAHRADRIERVLIALRERHQERSLRGPVPAALTQSLAGFAAQLAQVRAEERASGLSDEAAVAGAKPAQSVPR